MVNPRRTDLACRSWRRSPRLSPIRPSAAVFPTPIGNLSIGGEYGSHRCRDQKTVETTPGLDPPAIGVACGREEHPVHVQQPPPPSPACVAELCPCHRQLCFETLHRRDPF